MQAFLWLVAADIKNSEILSSNTTCYFQPISQINEQDLNLSAWMWLQVLDCVYTLLDKTQYVDQIVDCWYHNQKSNTSPHGEIGEIAQP